MREEHGKHNEELCIHLLEEGKFNDWAVTTAFYAALHYSQGVLFPLERETVRYSNFNDYYLFYLKKRKRARLSKHAAVMEVVRNERPQAYSPYKWLYDACMNARYKDFRISQKKAETAFARLDGLKTALFVKKIGSGAVEAEVQSA